MNNTMLHMHVASIGNIKYVLTMTMFSDSYPYAYKTYLFHE